VIATRPRDSILFPPKIVPSFTMKKVSPAEFKRLEQKIDLLNDKIDRIMEIQGIALVKSATDA